jgi:predicted ATPase/class 3 adenylate cyclase
MPDFPRGTVCFLFTDVEGSTRLWQAHPEAMHRGYVRHDAILRGAISRHGGVLYKTIGDAVQAAFSTSPAAVAAALEAQRALAAEPWEAVGLPEPLRVRMALHAGPVEPDASGDYRSPVLNRLGRLLGASHGGQVLLSLATYELARDHLPDGAGLRDLGEQRLKDLGRPEPVWQLLHPDLPERFPPLATLARTPNNLPAQPTALVGRERELAEVVGLLRREDVRLVTLTGPGGVGKTRLALQAAAELVEDFTDGAWFVDLAPVREPGLVPAVVAAALGVREAGRQPLEALLHAHLRERRLLLVLDNLEQVVAAAALVAELLAGAPGLTVLATSRIRLQLRAEREMVVPPLALPDRRRLGRPDRLTEYPAVRLFVERAQAARAGFVLDDASAPAVVEICHRLDGLPLAIELAAARVRLFDPEQLRDRLERRLPLLTGGARDLPARQRTLRDAIAWSHDLLAPDERILFDRLAVFAGGWTLEAADAVCDPEGERDLDALSGLAALVDQSLLRQDEAAGEPRFRMLETVREYAVERLEESGEGALLRRRHATYYLDLAEGAEPAPGESSSAELLARLEAEHDNLRAALHWTAERDAEAALRLAVACAGLWIVHGHFAEGRGWLERTLAFAVRAPDSEGTRLRAKALSGAGVLAYRQGDHAPAAALHEQSLALYRELGDRAGIATSLNNLGTVANDQGDYGRAAALHEESLALRRKLGDRPGIAMSLNNLGGVAFRQGDYARAAAFYREGLALRRELGDRPGIASSLNNLASIAGQRGDYVEAATLFEESLALYRAMGDRAGIAVSLNNLGEAAMELGDLGRAAALCAEGLVLRRETGNRRAIASSLEVLASIVATKGLPAPATRLLGAAAALREASGAPLFANEREEHDRQLARLREQLGGPAFTAASDQGRALSLDEAVAEALALAEQIGAGSAA